MIYIISQEGIKEADRKRLMELAKISHEEQTCIDSLRFLGVTLSKVWTSLSYLKYPGKQKSEAKTEVKKEKQRERWRTSIWTVSIRTPHQEDF